MSNKTEQQDIYAAVSSHELWRADRMRNGDSAEGKELSVRRKVWEGLSLKERQLASSRFENSHLLRLNAVGANFRNATFVDCKLKGVDFGNANLNGAVFHRCHLYAVDFAGANLASVTFADCAFENVDFVRANVVNVRGTTLMVMGNAGSRNDTTVYHVETDQVYCGCFRGTLKKFRNKIKETHRGWRNPHRREYLRMVRMFRRKQKEWEKKHKKRK